MKIRLIYPVITFNSIDIDVPNNQWEEIQNMSGIERAEFIESHIDQTDFDWIPDGKKGIESALEMGYASIKPVQF